MSEPLDELRGLLGVVEPSVGFEQRTLRHIADARAARARGRRWMLAVPAAAMVVLAVIVSSRTANPGGGLGDQAALPILTPVSAPLVRVETPVEHSAKPAPRVVRRARAVDAAWTIPENAHADQAIAVHQLMSMIHAGKARVEGDVVAANDAGPIPVLTPIELKPIVIAPLPNGQGGGSER